MYLHYQIQVLVDRLYELKEEQDKNEKAIERLEFINEQIEETINELEECIEKLKFKEQENKDDLLLFDSRE